MKKIVKLAMGAAMMYQAAKKYGIHSFKDLKEFVTTELKNVGNDVKHEVVA